MPAIPLGDLILEQTADARSSADEPCILYTLTAFASGEPERIAGTGVPADAQQLLAGDVLMSASLRHPRRAWVVGPAAELGLWATRDWIALRSPRHDADYLRHLLVSNSFLLCFERVMRKRSRAARNLRERLAGIDIPLPALVEQQRIVQVLDLAHGLRVQRQAMVPLLDELTRALQLEHAHADSEDSGLRLTAIAPLFASAQRSSLALDELLGTLRDLAFLGRLTCT